MLAEEAGRADRGPARGRSLLDRAARGGWPRTTAFTASVFEPDRWLDDGDTVTVGESDARRLSTAPATRRAMSSSTTRPPGSRSSATCCSRDRSAAPIFRWAISQDLIDAITTKLWPLGDDTTFVPGHGPMSNFGHERRTNMFVGRGDGAVIRRSGGRRRVDHPTRQHGLHRCVLHSRRHERQHDRIDREPEQGGPTSSSSSRRPAGRQPSMPKRVGDASEQEGCAAAPQPERRARRRARSGRSGSGRRAYIRRNWPARASGRSAWCCRRRRC